MTVNLGAFMLTAPFAVEVGPSYRQLVDLGVPEDCRWIVAGGASGDPRSPHYADQITPWNAGGTRPMRFGTTGWGGKGTAQPPIPVSGRDCTASQRML